MHIQVEGPSGGGHPIAAAQEGSQRLQHSLKPAQLHLVPGLQAHQGLILGEALHEGGHLIWKDFSRQLWAGGRVQDLPTHSSSGLTSHV